MDKTPASETERRAALPPAHHLRRALAEGRAAGTLDINEQIWMEWQIWLLDLQEQARENKRRYLQGR